MPELRPVFEELKLVMAPYAARLATAQDDESSLVLNTKFVQKSRKPMCFGAVMLKKSYVSYHLMPVYVTPGLLAGVSPALRRRMQGKSCFNFTHIDNVLFAELRALTAASLHSFQTLGYV